MTRRRRGGGGFATLAELRAAREMPWNGTKLRYRQTVFLLWLPDDDAAQLRFEFVEEPKRLKAA